MAQRVGAKSTIDTVVEVPWKSGMALGVGIEAISGQQRMKAVVDIPPPKESTTKNILTRMIMVEKEEDVERLLNVKASASFNMFETDSSFDTQLLNNTSFSTTQLSIVGYQQTEFSQYLPASYSLTNEAKDVSNTDVFRNKFGDYFVAGYSKSADFYAIYTCTATSLKDLTDFKSELKASNPSKFDAKASTDLTSVAKKRKIDVSCTIIMRGVKQSEVTPVSVDPDKVIDQLNMFNAIAEGEPTRAILWHYSLLGAPIPSTLEIKPEMMAQLAKLYKHSQIGQVLLASFPNHYKKEQKIQFDEILNKIKFNKEKLTSDEGFLSEVSGQINNWFHQSRLILAYEDLYYKCKNSNKKEGGTEDGKHYKWKYGIIHYEDNPDVTIEKKFEDKFKKDYELLKSQKHTFSYDDEKYKIVGYQVQANWHDGTCGSWKKISGGLLEDKIRIQVESKGSRGTSWTVRVYAVKRENFKFD